MKDGQQKNFTLPVALLDRWDEFLPKGSKAGSRNATGALFLYMLMPQQLREAACDAGYETDQQIATRHFWDRVQALIDDVNGAKILLGAAKAREEGSRKKKRGKKARSG